MTDAKDPELMSFIEQESQKQRVQAIIYSMTDECWQMCIDSTGSKLSSKQESCLTNCVERFIDTSDHVIRKLAEKGKSEIIATNALNALILVTDLNWLTMTVIDLSFTYHEDQTRAQYDDSTGTSNLMSKPVVDIEKFKIIMFDAKPYDRKSFTAVAKASNIQIQYAIPRLEKKTAKLAEHFDAVCVFVNDNVNKEVIEILHKNKIKLIALRCAGFNNVDLECAHKLNIKVVRVPAYSPYGVAEFSIGLLMTLNRRIHLAYNQIRSQNFQVDNLLGFNIFNCIVGVIGTGKIDEQASIDLDYKYDTLDNIYSQSRAILLFAPLTDSTKHMINTSSIKKMKNGVMIVNTSRGALIDTNALLNGLASGKIGGAGLDVYEHEKEYFFRDMSETYIPDDLLCELIRFPNVILTSHHAYLTDEALNGIATVTLSNINEFIKRTKLTNEVLPGM
ncbi:hypothetical protein GJ496_008578 [Pomphorhynchus laevis]|nr:hypothetical protein GJ496_008578 [Pomphorhynchus laevis]